MRKNKRVTPSEGQLELKFEAAAAHSEPLPDVVNNVLRVNFGVPKSVSLSGNKTEQALIERIIQNAQKLKW